MYMDLNTEMYYYFKISIVQYFLFLRGFLNPSNKANKRPDLNPTDVSGKKPSDMSRKSKMPCIRSLQSIHYQRSVPKREDKVGAGMCEACSVIHACAKQLL